MFKGAITTFSQRNDINNYSSSI